uniref:Pentacotripeptide-repeat region of PRORP domain-containing protein n=1 Tax=Salix viminalis TaxID=40686 RepID=A0A6N2N3R7_SALVM
MKSFEYRETAFGFFKFAFQDDSDEIVKSSCVAAHESWVDRRREVVEFMWKRHAEFESDFSVLDTLMRGFLKMEMSCEALEIVGRMREVGLRPSSSAITILFKLLLRVGDHGSVWKLLRGMIHQGPRPCNHNFNAVILGFCRLGHVKVGESLLYVMQKFKCQPDVYAYNILINAYCTRGQTVDALGWMHS